MVSHKQVLKNIKAEIERSNKIFIVYDTDPDGLTSFLQLKKTFPSKITGIPSFHKNSYKYEYFMNKIDLNDFDLIIYLVIKINWKNH